MLRIYEAQRYLLTSDMKIIDIAMEVGFGSMSNFYKYFKKTCGKNPKDYRKSVET
jgi:two-component system response regulator YesN